MTALLAPPARGFRGEILPVSPAIRARMEGQSWRGDDVRCPRWDALAYLRLDHVTFDGGSGEGELVVAAALAPRAVALFARLWQLGFPIRQMRLVDEFAADDGRSMAADNCSAFNFRVVLGTERLSQHALGLAIDINPVENPWRRHDGLVPIEGAAFADRRHVRPGMFVRPSPTVATLDDHGWEWGGDWLHAFDDHHIVWSRARR